MERLSLWNGVRTVVGWVVDGYRIDIGWYIFELHLDTVFCLKVDGCPLNMSTIQDYALMTTSTLPGYQPIFEQEPKST